MVFAIALNVARNHRRRERRQAGPVELPAASPELVSDPERRAAARDAFTLVQRFLQTLDEQRREVFVCALLEGMSALETAEATGLGLEAVQNRVRALRRSFKSWLSRQRRSV